MEALLGNVLALALSLAFAVATSTATVFNPQDVSFGPRDPTQSVTEYCQSFQYSVASGNLLKWSVPAECIGFVQSYTTGPQYLSDVKAAMSLALQTAQNFCARPGIDAWVFDVDGTLLSTTPYFATKQFGAGNYNDTDFNLWAARAVAPAIVPVRDFYRTLLRTNWTVFIISSRPQVLRSATVRNLRAAGYSGWKRLFMRQPRFQTNDANESDNANSMSAVCADILKANYDLQSVTSSLRETINQCNGQASQQTPGLAGNK